MSVAPVQCARTPPPYARKLRARRGVQWQTGPLCGLPAEIGEISHSGNLRPYRHLTAGAGDQRGAAGLRPVGGTVVIRPYGDGPGERCGTGGTFAVVRPACAGECPSVWRAEFPRRGGRRELGRNVPHGHGAVPAKVRGTGDRAAAAGDPHSGACPYASEPTPVTWGNGAALPGRRGRCRRPGAR
ncbi:hypothetical protein GCM10010129_46240 [Streptomyces fumigatiscleroticus]|nr:hypothetical protein GCM10010129_46240 [Streptomyces fumigatiscleroticus]